jgi:ribosomal protein L6P/L9E
LAGLPGSGNHASTRRSAADNWQDHSEDNQNRTKPMKHAFRTTRFRGKSKALIAKMITIVEEYQKQGLRLTARQLYYQFVSRDYINNTQKSYRNITNLLADARYAGLIDWNAIEDRGRSPLSWRQYNNIGEMIMSGIKTFRLPRWDTQEKYIELWVEKQALAGVLQPIAMDYHATLMVNKGYSSASAMYEASNRFLWQIDKFGHTPVLFYLGDHDPSGEDMVRDIESRLVEFGIHGIEVRKLALTMAQIEEFNPPPNPAKLSDSRAAKYIAEHGQYSWEVDALPPQELNRLIREAFESEIDHKALKKVIKEENRQKDMLTKFIDENPISK